MDSYNRYSRNVNRDYFWDEPDFESNYQRMEESRKEDWDEELEGEEFIPEPETHRFIYFIQEVKTGKCLVGDVEGFSSYEECYDQWDYLGKILDNNL